MLLRIQDGESIRGLKPMGASLPRSSMEQVALKSRQNSPFIMYPTSPIATVGDGLGFLQLEMRIDRM